MGEPYINQPWQEAMVVLRDIGWGVSKIAAVFGSDRSTVEATIEGLRDDLQAVEEKHKEMRSRAAQVEGVSSQEAVAAADKELIANFTTWTGVTMSPGLAKRFGLS